MIEWTDVKKELPTEMDYYLVCGHRPGYDWWFAIQWFDATGRKFYGTKTLDPMFWSPLAGPFVLEGAK